MKSCMADDARENPNGSRDTLEVIRLSKKDLEDAKRLLSLLTVAEVDFLNDRRTSRDGTGEQFPQQKALEILALRRKRFSTFGKAMFGEPAWEMLLLLYGTGRRQTISRLGDTCSISKSTAIRWIDYLEAQRWVARKSHPTDKRAIIVELTEKGREAIELYLSETVSASD